jgi:predicted secreted hydrolase
MTGSNGRLTPVPRPMPTLSRGRSRSRRSIIPRLGSLMLLAVLAAGCGGPLLANAPAPHPVVTPASTPTSAPPDPRSIQLPADDGPHDRLTEWWYYTGHLATDDGRRFGFEFVVFRAERGGFPVSWASHLALTDESGGAFHYAQRSQIGSAADVRAANPDRRFAFAIRGSPTDPGGVSSTPWSMAGGGGTDRLAASATGAEVEGDPADGFGIELDLASSRPPVLHDGSGWIDFGPAGGSYYVSRPDMRASGTLTLGSTRMRVEGTAWFDHQWGDFISVGGGGWDWFAINLDDGTDLMLSLVRAADGSYPLAYGTLVDPAGGSRTLAAGDFMVDVVRSWTSPATGTTYPAGWMVELPAERLIIELRPTVAQQELDTRATTGVAYWEGSQIVAATRDGRTLGGQAYVELTGYASR